LCWHSERLNARSGELQVSDVITLSVQTGSGGFGVARRVAERLGYRYYDWEITSEAAARAGVTPNEVIAAERVPGFIERIMRRLGAVSTVSVDAGVFTEPTPAMWNTAIQSLTSDDYRQIIERIVIELASQGQGVIVGHAAQYTLRDTPNVLRVLVHGSLKRRAERMAEEQGIALAQATAAVKQSDRDRTELLKRLYHFDWLDASMYDLTLNTDRLSLDFATDAIVEAAGSTQ
jgi:CMP/dCMP kinase